MAERQLRDILDQLASPPPSRKHRDTDSDTKTNKVTDKATGTAFSLLSSFLHPKMTARPPPPPPPAQTPGLTSARLNSLLDMLSFTGKRKAPPALNLRETKGKPRSAEDEEDEEDEDDDDEIEKPDGQPLRRGSASSSTTTATPTDPSPHLDTHCVDMDRHWRPQSPQSPQRSGTGTAQWSGGGRGSGKRVRFSDVVMVVG